MALKPLNYDDPLYQLLRDGNIKEFNRRKSEMANCQLVSFELRYLDLRGIDAAGIDFSNSYFRSADLRGIDFSKAWLEGCQSQRRPHLRRLLPRRTDSGRDHSLRHSRHAHALPEVAGSHSLAK